MSGIVLSSSVRQNLLSLQSTADLLATTQNRLATGKKVNTALDNPTNFFTAQSLDSRAGDINNLLDSIGSGVQVLQAANTGITSLQKLVDTAKSIANQALQSAVGYTTKSNVSATITGATANDLRGTTTYTSATASSNVLFSGAAGGTTAATAATTLGGTIGVRAGTAVTDNQGVPAAITATTLIYARHAKSADAGYAALQSYAKEAQGLKDEAQKRVVWRSIASSLRFAERFPQDPRVAGVLTNTAEQYTTQGEPKLAVATAKRVLAIQPEVSRDLQRTNWTVVAHGEFDLKNYARAEEGYKQVLALTDPKAANRHALTERLAASVYKQGEEVRAAGKGREAVGHFQRVALLTPAASIRVNADYDAAAGLIALKDWAAAATALEAFRRNYPKHALQSELPGKLALVYLEGGQPAKAAAEFESIAAGNKDVRLSRDALWQAAELYDKAGQQKSAIAAYERYLKQYPSPLEPAIEIRQKLIDKPRKEGQEARATALTRELYEAERNGGKERTARTRALGAQATLVLAEPLANAYREVKLVEPLKKNLKLKKERMQKALEAYGVAAESGVAEVATAAVYRSADLYTDFSQSLLKSQRPKGLNADETEQYNILLEEQAFPFEEKAIEIHEINSKRASQGIYDNHVKQSFAALAKLRPGRYAKSEKTTGVVHAIR